MIELLTNKNNHYEKIVLFLFPLLLLSCNTKEDEPNNPKMIIRKIQT